ncbi:MAG: UpxY family transcription antiterminator [Nitrospiraceae bacterium]|nr:UpxY family transcription antiterminator [Nitrospiraceae bacterium]
MLNWYAAYVKSRHEFVAQSELGRKGVQTFLPTIKKLNQWKDRKKLVEFPLFPGYLFVNVPSYPSEFVNVLKTRGVVSILASGLDGPVPVPQDEIESLKIMLTSGGDGVNVYPHLKSGALVRVKRGPLKGARGAVMNSEGEHIFVVNIDILGRSIGIKVYANDLEPE